MKRLLAIFIIALSFPFAVLRTHAQCAPSQIGSPCPQGGIASAGHTEPGISLAAGNPVHLVTGNKYQRDIDLPPNPSAPGIELIRHYNAMDTRPSVLGRGWVLSYDTRLFRVRTGWQIVQADGTRLSFPDASTTQDGAHHSRHGRLEHAGGQHRWLWPSGTTFVFNQRGHLTSIQWANGETITIARHTVPDTLYDTIQTITNTQGHTLTFHYTVVRQQARLTAVDTPFGQFRYHYDDPSSLAHADPYGSNATHTATPPPHRLIRITRPDAMQRYYLHEPMLQSGHPYALTGIALSSGDDHPTQRTNTWIYDTRGRVSATARFDPYGLSYYLHFDYQRTPVAQRAGLTVITDNNQKTTHVQTAVRGDRHVITAVHGAGCPGCPAPGTHADYDAQGRLIHVNGTHIRRSTQGMVRSIQPSRAGWPGLDLHYRQNGLRDQWHSASTGTERIQYNPQGLPVSRHFANGDSTVIDYDAQLRPVTIRETHGAAHSTTHLHWHGPRLTRIEHPSETEIRHHDPQGRVIQREIRRPMAHQQDTLRLTEHFSYDDEHRMTAHYLPEGGSLHYTWGHGQQLKAIDWQDAHGKRQSIIETVPGQAGYRYGNGLHLDTAARPDHLVQQLRLHMDGHVMWAQELSYDSQQRITIEKVRHHQLPTVSTDPGKRQTGASVSAWHYAYDTQSRLTGVRHVTDRSTLASNQPSTTTPSETMWLAWHPEGSAAAQRTGSETLRPVRHRDDSGLVIQTDGYDLSYGPSRRLNRIMRDGQTIATYQHNAFGYRIRRQGADDHSTDYFYLNNQVVAQADSNKINTKDSPASVQIARRYIYAHHVPVALIDYSHDAPEGQYFAIHADLQGAPRLITDSKRQIRWQAHYSPLGQVHRHEGDMHLALRLPGQIEDPATGWHDNLLRTYLPQWGHYLEPDPLGPLPGNDAYGYAAQQPRRYTDPMGLLLFAFDGTRQSADTQSNVWKMSQYYLDGPVHYHPGPGNATFINWDAATAHQAVQIVETQWKWLLYELSRPRAPDAVTPIDILGFSRGAALARHFGNLILQHVDQGRFRFDDPLYGAVSACVDLRFMGLFDTVAQFGLAGTHNHNYDLNIAAAWEWVAHAVALHERRWLFPLTAASNKEGHNITEAPFVGAHSDIGGGVLPSQRDQEGGRSDLSNVALGWMLWQAQAASVAFGKLEDSHTTITQPILHDFRSQTGRTQDSDRRIDNPQGKTWLNNQHDHAHLGAQPREQTEPLITRADQWRHRATPEVGLVNMDGYAQWLHDELGWQMSPV